MQKLLLDTHVLIWFLQGNRSLGEQAQAAISDPQNDIYVSAASLWEMSIKKALGKLTYPDGLNGRIAQLGFLPLAIDLFHGEQAGSLPDIHKDPFDRMLIAQAQAEGLTLLTTDRIILRYGLRTLNAAE